MLPISVRCTNLQLSNQTGNKSAFSQAKIVTAVWRKLMKLFRQIFFMLLVSSLIFGQSSTNNTNSDDNRISNQIKSLQDAIASQQQQIESLRQELAARKQADSMPHLANAALTTPSTTSLVQ